MSAKTPGVHDFNILHGELNHHLVPSAFLTDSPTGCKPSASVNPNPPDGAVYTGHKDATVLGAPILALLLGASTHDA